MNKMLALSKVQARLVARGGEAGRELSQTLAEESVPVGLLISEEKFEEACRKAAAIEAKYRLNLAREQENMVSAEQLLADGGKGSGSCSIADAAKMQMEVHSQLQAEVDAGRKPQEIFEEFGKDTLGIGEFLSTNPSKACELLTRLKGKYGIE